MKTYPAVADAYHAMSTAVAEAGPLDAKTRELIKIGIAIGSAQEGATHSHVRKALDAVRPPPSPFPFSSPPPLKSLALSPAFDPTVTSYTLAVCGRGPPPSLSASPSLPLPLYTFFFYWGLQPGVHAYGASKLR